MLEDEVQLNAAILAFQPDVIVHLAAQAGVRYSIDNPRAYLDANISGTFNVMEAARTLGVSHLLMASTSSVYGANIQMPFTETERVATPLAFYAATKLANEAMGHSYAHIYNLPITTFRFFTVYGPWGRPDMAYFKFAQNIIEGKPIDIYNNGEMWRDFIEAIEAEIGTKAIRNYMPMQQGDVPATWANASLLHSLTGYRPEMAFREGVARFVHWYCEYYLKQKI
jgi:UDP-glucuronate 4-epimerase